VTLVIDNYDSFTFNLVQMLEAAGAGCRVVRNDALSVQELIALRPDRVVVSPGPGRPEDAGVTVDLFRALAPSVPTLGVCLGHQALAVALGGSVGPAVRLMHGKADWVHHDGSRLFTGLSSPFEAGRYHSLAVVDVSGTPWRVTAHADDGTVMAMEHPDRPWFGVQFHPESILTPDGARVLENFLGQ
jgi:anthranilate synthase component 2